MPAECRYSRRSYHSNGFMSSFLFLLLICSLGMCLFYGRGINEPDVVIVQQPGVAQGYAVDGYGNVMVDQHGRPVQQMGGNQTVVVQGGGYGGFLGSLANCILPSTGLRLPKAN